MKMFDNVSLAPGMTLDLPEAHQLAAKMSAAWAAFARNGDPNIDVLPEWPVYDTEMRGMMVFDNETRVVEDPYREKRLAWEGIEPQTM